MLTYTFSHQQKKKKTEAETPRGRPLFQQVYVMCFWGSKHPTEKLHHVLTITSKQEKKNLQHTRWTLLAPIINICIEDAETYGPIA